MTVKAEIAPVDASETRSISPKLPEQGPTGRGANTDELLAALGPAVLRRACLVNDFVAVGFGVPAVPRADLVTIHAPAGRDGSDPAERGVKGDMTSGTLCSF